VLCFLFFCFCCCLLFFLSFFFVFFASGGWGGLCGVVDRVEARDRLLSVRQRVEPERESFLPAPLASEL